MIPNILTSTVLRRNHFIARNIWRQPLSCSLHPQIQVYSSSRIDKSSSATDLLALKLDRTSPKSLSLPDLPLPVHGYPTFWIHSRDAEEYLYPLYRRGWGIKSYPRSLYKDPHHHRYVAHLTTDFTFPNYNCAAQFLADFNPICEVEKHHSSSFSLQNHGTHPTLTLYIQTHTAGPPLSRRVPGISRRDLRFTLLVEQLYDTYFRDGPALERRGTIVRHYLDQPKWEHFVSRFVRSSLKTSPEVDASPPSQLAELAGAVELLGHENERSEE